MQASNWYVMQVFTGREEEMKRLCEAYIEPCLLRLCFCPKYECYYKKAGERRVVTRLLFPGYLFLDTDDVEAVNRRLCLLPEMTKILKIGEEFVPITSAEQAFIEAHGNAEHVFELSRGYMAGEEVDIVEGAFAGYRGRLDYVDRHNRFGIMNVNMFGKRIRMRFGLEIVTKATE